MLGRFVVGVPLVNVPWSSCPGWKWLPACLEPRVPGSCLGWCVPGSCPGWRGYLHALNLVPCWLVCPCSWCVLVVGVLGGGYLHSLVVRALVVGVSLCALVVGRLVVGGYLCALELVLCWLVSLVGVVTWIP